MLQNYCLNNNHNRKEIATYAKRNVCPLFSMQLYLILVFPYFTTIASPLIRMRSRGLSTSSQRSFMGPGISQEPEGSFCSRKSIARSMTRLDSTTYVHEKHVHTKKDTSK